MGLVFIKVKTFSFISENKLMVNWRRLIIPGITTIILGISISLNGNTNLVEVDHVAHMDFPVDNMISRQLTTTWFDRMIVEGISLRRVVELSLAKWKLIHIEKQESIKTNPSSSRSPCTNGNNGSNTPILTYDNKKFRLNGADISPFGIRVVNSLQSDAITADFIDHLYTMKAYGIQSVKVGIQGGRAFPSGNSLTNGYNADGSLKADVFGRLENVLNATASRRMVLVIQMFYRGKDQELTDDQAVLAAVENTVNWLETGGWKHYWLHVINEWYHGGYDHDQIKTAEGQVEIYNLIKSINPDIITFVSDAEGANDGFYADTGYTASNGDVVVEYHQGDTYDNPGVYISEVRSQTIADATTTFNNGGYWFLMSGWHQKADLEGWPRFDKGGEGSLDSPGTSFIWNTLKYLSQSYYLPLHIHLPIIIFSN